MRVIEIESARSSRCMTLFRGRGNSGGVHKLGYFHILSNAVGSDSYLAHFILERHA